MFKSMFLVFLSLVLSERALAQAEPTTCSSLIGTCEYYDCVEHELLACGSEGYVLGYGKRYCEKFAQVRPLPHLTPHEKELFPVEWNSWLQKTAQCLHSAIDDYFLEGSSRSCSTLRSAAFASHAHCYTTGDSFCFLPPRQVANIGSIISVRGFSQAETRRQVAETAAICVQQIDSRLEHESSPLNRLELTAYRNSWSLIASPQ